MKKTMTKTRAEEILGDAIDPIDNGLSSVRYLSWTPGDRLATLDDSFTADELEAIAWWMRNQ
jgi:hypothetical protein